VAIGLAAALTFGIALRPADSAGPCTVAQRTAHLPEIPEASGLAISRRHHGILWSHNDSGNAAVLYAIDETGVQRARIRVPIVTRDWEDISAATCPAGTCLYLADIGDNQRVRSAIRIHRLPEPALTDAATPAPDTFTATYADGAQNAESLFLAGGHVFIVTRDRAGALYRSTEPLLDRRDLKLERIGELGLAAASDAETSPDEATVVVRTMKGAFFYRTADIVRGGAIQPALAVDLEGLREPQGEGVAIGPGGMLYLASEGRPWHRTGRFMSLHCELPAAAILPGASP
jgi:hypothetical protein